MSKAGNQPFVWNDYALVVNGEIWNYPQLRKEYEERGYTFFSNSDSEIILYLYKENELKRLEDSGTDLENSKKDFERLLLLNNHVDNIFKEKLTKIHSIGKKK